MKDLGPDARELVDAHRTDGALTPADRKRIKHKVMLRVAALGATTAVAREVSANASATAAAKAAGMSLASKVVVVALGVTAATAVVSVSLWALRSRAPSNRTPSATSARTMTDVVAPAPGPAGAPTVAAPATAPARTLAVLPAVVGAPASAAARTRAAPPRVAIAAPGSAPVRRPVATPEVVTASPISSAAVDSRHDDPVKTIDKPPESPPPPATVVVPPDPEPELRALREAREDLRAGRPASAYHRLDDFDRQRGGGMLAQERSALSAIALCQWQPGPNAQARAAEFLRSSPESPLAIRVKSACARGSKASP
jgi:hypothetical protein